LLVSNDPEAWVKAIAELADDAPRRAKMALAAIDRARSLAWRAEKSGRGLRPGASLAEDAAH
jgi:glycosyltransferase involved in cell wall biosynthesis